VNPCLALHVCIAVNVPSGITTWVLYLIVGILSCGVLRGVLMGNLCIDTPTMPPRLLQPATLYQGSRMFSFAPAAVARCDCSVFQEVGVVAVRNSGRASS
jgi:hypothetical protein